MPETNNTKFTKLYTTMLGEFKEQENGDIKAYENLVEIVDRFNDFMLKTEKEYLLKDKNLATPEMYALGLYELEPKSMSEVFLFGTMFGTSHKASIDPKYTLLVEACTMFKDSLEESDTLDDKKDVLKQFLQFTEDLNNL